MSSEGSLGAAFVIRNNGLILFCRARPAKLPLLASGAPPPIYIFDLGFIQGKFGFAHHGGSVLIAPVIDRPVFIDVVGVVWRERIDSVQCLKEVALAGFILTHKMQ